MSLHESRDRNVVVYFYPKAETPGLHHGSVRLPQHPRLDPDFRPQRRGNFTGFSELAGRLHQKPRTDLSAAFSADNAVATAWDAYGDKELNGKTVTGIIRSTIVVDPGRRVQSAEYGVDAKGHVAKLKTASRSRLRCRLPPHLSSVQSPDLRHKSHRPRRSPRFVSYTCCYPRRLFILRPPTVLHSRS